MKKLFSFLAVAVISVTIQIPLQGADSDFVIGKIDTNFQNSPNIPGGSYNKQGGGRPSPWLEIEVPFNWAPKDAQEKTLDSYTVNYYVLIKNTKQDPKGTLLTGSVAHCDLVVTRDMKRSVMYVAPSSLSKLFEGKTPTVLSQVVAGVGVEISVGGTVAAEATTSGKPGWWNDSSAYTVASGVLVDKSKTPFAPLAWDYYEPIKDR